MIIFKQKNDNNQNYLTAHDIASHIVKTMNYENLSEISNKNISKYYEVPSDIVIDSAMYVSTRTDSCNEIACFQLNNQENQEKLLKIISDYIETKKNTYKDVNEKAYNTVCSAKTEVIYPYVFIAITPDSETAVSAFRELINSDKTSFNEDKN